MYELGWYYENDKVDYFKQPEDPKTTPKDPTKGELIFEWEEEEADTNKRN